MKSAERTVMEVAVLKSQTALDAMDSGPLIMITGNEERWTLDIDAESWCLARGSGDFDRTRIYLSTRATVKPSISNT